MQLKYTIRSCNQTWF